MDIYVGNLAYATTDDSLRAAFEAFGEVTSARVVLDRISHRSKGFGFVEMPNEAEANAAIEALNGSAIDGREIRCNESQTGTGAPRREGGFGGRGRGGFRREGGFGKREGGFGGGRGGFGGGASRGERGSAPRREGGYGHRSGGYGNRSGGYGSGRGYGRGSNYQPRESQW